MSHPSRAKTSAPNAQESWEDLEDLEDLEDAEDLEEALAALGVPVDGGEYCEQLAGFLQLAVLAQGQPQVMHGHFALFLLIVDAGNLEMSEGRAVNARQERQALIDLPLCRRLSSRWSPRASATYFVSRI